jgi:hypothetical protein
MIRSARTQNRPGSRMLDRLAVDRKKTILAVGLVAVMAIMWVRVLTGEKPQQATAEPSQADQSTETEPVKVRAVELPVVEGRNDCIRRDFFSADAVADFRRDSTSQNTGTDTEVRVGTSQQVQEVVARVAQKLRLSSETRQACINDRLLRVGETLSVKDGTAVYVFEVLQIQEDSVLVRCNGKEVTLKLTQVSDAID